VPQPSRLSEPTRVRRRAGASGIARDAGRADAPALGILASASAVATWVLLLVGCLVHGTGSSLACPDWPLCFGSALPKMENGVQYEHSHRLVATAVGLLTIVLAVLLHRRRAEDPRGAKLGYLAVGLVCWQGTLGGITVLLRLPLLVTMAHLTTSMIFFCLMTLIALRGPASRGAAPPGAGRGDEPRSLRRPDGEESLAALRPWVGAAAAGTLVQIILGGLVRHTASGLACFGIPLCNGDLWPSHYGAHLHMTHRLFAVGLGTFVVGVAVTVRRRAPGTRMARLAVAAIALVLLQITLGVLSVYSLLALLPVTLHLGVAALLLVCNVALFYYLPAAVPQAEGARMRDEARAW
jgi:heme A synthase